MNRVQLKILAAAAIATVAMPVTADTIDYTGVTEGTNIDGVQLGTVTISSPTNQVNYIVEGGGSNKAYGAPNVSGFPANGCLPVEGGFSDLSIVNNTTEGTTAHHYDFTFTGQHGEFTADSFQITMFDFGDFNPANKTYHQVVVSAWDMDGALINSDTLDLYTTSATNPKDGSYTAPLPYNFNPYVEADACTTAGDPPLGQYTFVVVAEGIAKVTLDVMTASDPKIGFGDVEFNLEPCEGAEVAMCAGQTNDIGEVSVNNDDENLYVTFSIAEAGWYLNETHVAIGKSVDDIPQTSKGNPIPGQFPYACDLVEPMQTSCTVTIPLEDCCAGEEIIVAAHAAVDEIAGDGCETETFWATSVVGNVQGTLRNGTPFLLTSERINPLNALGAPDFPGANTFYSLGFDLDVVDPVEGWLTVGFDFPVYNGPGDDIVVQEVTNGRGSYPEEKAEVFGVNGSTDYFAGVVSNNDAPDGLGSANLPDGMTTFDSVKLLDATVPSLFDSRPTADAYDVDAVGACYLLLSDETAWGDGCDGTRFVEKGNWGTYITYTINDCAEGCEE